MNCKYCKNTFKTKGILSNHMKSAKYCLEIQKSIGITLSKNPYTCEFCKTGLSQQICLDRHLLVCRKRHHNIQKVKYENKIYDLERQLLKQKHEMIKAKEEHKDEVRELKDEIKDLQNKLGDVALKAVSRPTTISNKTLNINNYINTLQPLTDEHITDNVDNLTIDHIKRGPEGYADCALVSWKDKIVCTDYARRKVKYKDSDDNVVTDPELTILAKKFFSAIKDKNKELVVQYGNDMRDKFKDHMDIIVEMCDNRLHVDRSSEGEKSDFFHDFVRHVCTQTIRE